MALVLGPYCSAFIVVLGLYVYCCCPVEIALPRCFILSIFEEAIDKLPHPRNMSAFFSCLAFLSRARKEFYPHPGAKGAVYSAAVREECLARRLTEDQGWRSLFLCNLPDASEGTIQRSLSLGGEVWNRRRMWQECRSELLGRCPICERLVLNIDDSCLEHLRK